MSERVKATVTCDGGRDGLTVFGYHFPFGEAVEVELPQHKLDWLADRACIIESTDIRPRRKVGRPKGSGKAKSQTFDAPDPEDSILTSTKFVRE